MRGSGAKEAAQDLHRRDGASADLPLLPLFNAVLLPGGIVRVVIPAGWSKSTALVQLLLEQRGGEVLVAAVPYLTPGGNGAGGSKGTYAATVGGGSLNEDEGAADEQLDLDRLHHSGTAARVLQMARRTQSGGWTVTLEGRCRVRIRSVHLSSRPPQEHYEASVEQLDYFAGASSAASSATVSATAAREQEDLSQQLLKGTQRLFVLIQGEGEGWGAAARVARALAQQGPARMSDVLGSLVARALPDRLGLLGELDVTERLQLVVPLLNEMLEMAEKAAAGGSSGSSRGRTRRSSRLGGNRALRLPPGLLADEQGEEEEEEEDSKRELAALMEKLKAASPPSEVLRTAQREYKRLQRGSDQHPGYSMSLTYLETLADLPWNRHSGQQAAQPPKGPEGSDTQQSRLAMALPSPAGISSAKGQWQLPLDAVRQRLDEAHYGLEKVKERIVQYVAVQRLRGWDARAPILCFIGPPGVGKTSLARSIAEVLGRPFQRISLGGVRDEAEIRGHRRTYIGAMPGRMIQALRKAGVRDPLLLLDEVDKMGRDAARGDPSAALLEVLDPEQNTAFVDTYLGLPFDLSACLFVATANRGSDIPPPLLDRLEVVHLGGYTREEKVHIGERHLIPRLLAEHGLHQGQLVFPPDTVRSMIEGWTREAGVRSLARALAAVCRHVAVQVVQRQEELLKSGGDLDPLGSIEDSSGGIGRGKQPVPLPLPAPFEEEARGDAGAAATQQFASPVPASATATAARTTRTEGISWQNSSSSGGGAGPQLQLQMPAGNASTNLWVQLAPLAIAAGLGGAGGSTPIVGAAIGGYPWPRLPEPVPSRFPKAMSQATAPSASIECSCSQRKHQGWFAWLRWPWNDSSAEQQPHHEACSNAASATQCSCAGACSDHDCCCGMGSAHEQTASTVVWAREGGLAADSRSWEQSWRQSAATTPSARADGPRLCGPGSMQVIASTPQLAATTATGMASTAGGWQAATAGADDPPDYSRPTASTSGPHPWQNQWRTSHLLASDLDGLQEANAIRPLPPHPHQRQVVVDEALLVEVLGPRRFECHSVAERVAAPGTAAGLVWTAVGGKVQYIECMCVGTTSSFGGSGSRASGQLTLTGQLGEVLEESARIALSWVRAHAAALGLPGDSSCPSRKWDVHIHLPAGAVPKDGPSAGITLAVALVSLFTERCVRSDVAMTGELTLRGLVLPVGGIKEKLLAAQAAGMARVLVPSRNMPDVQADVSAEVRQALEVVPCQRLEDVLQAAFDPPLVLKQQPLLARL